MPPFFDTIANRPALRAAFARVADRGGCRGVDGVTVGAFAERLEWELDRLLASLDAGRYRPLPLLRFAVPKRSRGVQNGWRFLSVPAVRDRVLQAAVYLATKDRLDAELEESSHAFREGRSVRTALARVAELREDGYRFLVRADIDDFFDRVAHDLVLARWRRLGFGAEVDGLIASWLAAEVYDGSKIVRLRRGLPQGAVVSPMLANLVLDQFDEHLALFGQKAVRYADDFAILCRTPSEAEDALELTEYLLAELRLALNAEKSQVTSFDQGFGFLGAIFQGDAIYLPFDRPKPEEFTPQLPPPLDLVGYLELAAAAVWGEV